MSKPITLYSHATGPNPWKVAIILEELKIPYITKLMEMADLKKEPFEKNSIPMVVSPPSPTPIPTSHYGNLAP
ncbi:hypothetical protein DID88_000097 [Monilinia fructigena]|uniref:GST N-terminal domain-containing protein n=1 Tax=Monilinia fructigena TaxID=38457 RepID=A0A395IJF7_9HELO|nr:hypothetical protein DID88_000097 [Monilinia fructigena]